MDVKPASVICPQCKSENPSTSTVCSYCGASLRALEPDQQSASDGEGLPGVASLRAAAPEKGKTSKPDPIREAQISLMRGRMKAGANWYYAIAILSLVNTIIFLTGNYRYFIVGLGLTQLIDSISAQLIKNIPNLKILIQAVGLTFDILAAGVFAWFGYQAHKRHDWAYSIGMGLYALDGALFAWLQDYLGLGFHLFVLYGLYLGRRANRDLKKSEEVESADRLSTP